MIITKPFIRIELQEIKSPIILTDISKQDLLQKIPVIAETYDGSAYSVGSKIGMRYGLAIHAIKDGDKEYFFIHEADIVVVF